MKNIRKITFIALILFLSLIFIDKCKASIISSSKSTYDYFDNYSTIYGNVSVQGDYIDSDKIELTLNFSSEYSYSQVTNEPVIIIYDTSGITLPRYLIEFKAKMYKLMLELQQANIDFIALPSNDNILGSAYNIDIPSTIEENEVERDLTNTERLQAAIPLLFSQKTADFWISRLKYSSPEIEKDNDGLYVADSDLPLIKEQDSKIIYITTYPQNNFIVGNNNIPLERISCNNTYQTYTYYDDYEEEDVEYKTKFYNIFYGYKYENDYCKNFVNADASNLVDNVLNIVSPDTRDNISRYLTLNKYNNYFEIESVDDISFTDGKVEQIDEERNDEYEDETYIETTYKLSIDNYKLGHYYKAKIILTLKDEYANDSSLDSYDFYMTINNTFNQGTENKYNVYYFSSTIFNTFNVCFNKNNCIPYKVGSIVNLKDYEPDPTESPEFMGWFVPDDGAEYAYSSGGQVQYTGDFSNIRKISDTQFYMPGHDVYVQAITGYDNITKGSDSSSVISKTDNNANYNMKIEDDINFLFADNCWEYIEDSAGKAKKLIYNGEPDDYGMCGTDRGTHDGIEGTYEYVYLDGLYASKNYFYNRITDRFYLIGNVQKRQDLTDTNGMYMYLCKDELVSGENITCTELYYVPFHNSLSSNYYTGFKVGKNISYDSVGYGSFHEEDDLAGLGYMSKTYSTRNVNLNNTGSVTYFETITNLSEITYGTSYTKIVDANNNNVPVLDDPTTPNSLSELVGKYIYNTDSSTKTAYGLKYVTDVHDNGISYLFLNTLGSGTNDLDQANKTYHYADSYFYSEYYNKYVLRNSDSSASSWTTAEDWHQTMQGKEEFYMCINSDMCSADDMIHVYKTGLNGYMEYIYEPYGTIVGTDHERYEYSNDTTYDSENSKLNLADPIQLYPDYTHRYVCLYHVNQVNGRLNYDDSCQGMGYIIEQNYIPTTGNNSYYGSDVIVLKTIFNISHEKSEEAANNLMHSSVTNSNIKTIVDAWYDANLLNYRKYLVDIPFEQNICIANLNTFDHNSSNYNTIDFGATCNDLKSTYTISNEYGNGKLKYPIGIFSEGPTSKTEPYWIGTLGTDKYYSYGNSNILTYYNPDTDDISLADPTTKMNIRPVIYLSPAVKVIGGDGSTENPYVLDDGSYYSYYYKNLKNIED